MDEKSIAFSAALVALFKGFISRDAHTKHWNTLQTQQTQVEDYVSKLGLTLIVDDTDGYAYLKQQTQTEDHLDIPRLVPRHKLSYQVSVILVLLRKQLLEFDSGSNADERLILTKQELVDQLHPYLSDTSDEAKQMKDIDANLNKIRDMGFVRMIDSVDGRFEVYRILRSFVDAQLLGEMDKRLQEYVTTAQSNKSREEPAYEPE